MYIQTTRYEGICSHNEHFITALGKQAQICAEGCEGDDLCCFATKPQKYITGTKVRLDPRLGIRLDYAQVRSLVTILQG